MEAMRKHSQSEQHENLLPLEIASAGIKLKVVKQELYKTTGKGFMNRISSVAGISKL